MTTFILLTKLNTIIIPFLILILLDCFNVITKNQFKLWHIIIVAIIFVTGLIRPVMWFVNEIDSSILGMVHIIVTIVLALIYVINVYRNNN